MIFFFNVFPLRSYSTTLLIYEWEGFTVCVIVFMPLSRNKEFQGVW